MSLKKSLAFITALCIFSGAFCQKVIETEGTGKTEDLAKSSALQQMSQTFRTYVQSSTDASQSMTQTEGKKTKTTSIATMERRILVSSEMPLYGVTFKSSNNGKKGDQLEFTVTATMNSKNALPSYKKEIKNLTDKINARVKALPGLTGDKEDNEWQLLSADYAAFDKLEMVMHVLGEDNKNLPELSSADFRIRYEQRAKEITNLEKAGEVIAAAIVKQAASRNIYVYPALFEGENTSTEFSIALANSVKTKLGRNLALTKLTSNSELKGSYYFAPGSVDGEDIIVSYYLCHKDGSVLASSGMIKIPYRVYSPYKYIPRNYDLQSEIAAGRVANPAFDVSIRINGDRNALELKRADPLIIEVRASAPCYIYVLGYVYNDETDPYTYLYPFYPALEGKEMFVRKIGANEINRWVCINPVMDDEVQALEVEPPYGEEMLYVFASTTDDYDEFVSKIPSYIETDTAYVVSGSPVQTVAKTRAINIKRVANKASKVVNTAESTVSFASHK